MRLLIVGRLVRFDEFAAKKEQEARTASIAPLATVADHGDRTGLRAIGNEWTARAFDGSFYVSTPRSGLPSTSLVFVQSRDGNTGAANPETLGGGLTDKHVIYEGLSRVAADAVLAASGTVRSARIVFSVWHPEIVALRASLGLPRHPIQIVATRRGMSMEDTLLFNVPELRVMLLTPASVVDGMQQPLEARPWVKALPMREGTDLREPFRELRRLGISTISCIGGRTLAAQLIDSGLVDDVYLTVSPKEGGEPNTPLYPKPLGGEIVVKKRGTGSDEGVTFTHLKLK